MSLLKSLLRGGEKLIDSASREAVVSLENGKAMYVKVMAALRHEVDANTIEEVKKMDWEINQHQIDVRKMVFEHLSISSGSDLFTSLVLLSVVIDTERIGDYVKNISEIIENFPSKMEFDEFENVVEELDEKTVLLFDLTKEAFVEGDEAKAETVMDIYGKISPLCDNTIKTILNEKAAGGTVKTSYLVLVLMIRHIKRITAHLKNIASTVVNPFDRIGYQHRGEKN